MSADRIVGWSAAAGGAVALLTDPAFRAAFARIDPVSLAEVLALYVMALFSVAIVGAFGIVAWEAFIQPTWKAVWRVFRKVQTHVR